VRAVRLEHEFAGVAAQVTAERAPEVRRHDQGVLAPARLDQAPPRRSSRAKSSLV
jgi:hypothetical protein